MKQIKLPARPEDVKPSDNEWIATEILGWEKKTEKHIRVDFEKIWNYYKDNKLTSFGQFNLFNPFTNIQHSKMLDGWLVENNLQIQMNFHEGFHGWHFHYTVFDMKKVLTQRCLIDIFNKSEPFARTSAIVKAWMEINNK